MKKRKVKSENPSLRRELELFVASTNISLKKVVKTMPPIILLRNAHPSYRGNFATELKNTGLINENELKEFTKIS